MARGTRALTLSLAIGSAAALAPAGSAAAQVDSSALRARTWIRPLASLAVPGFGQLLGHQDRGAVYGAVELYVLSRYIQLEHAGDDGANAFRQLAFQVAQRGFATTRRDTIFEYYETMEKFVSSGEFDRDPGPGLAPETDPSTYNGSVWLLARRTFWPDPGTPPPPTSPAYQKAVAFYVQHAVGPGYRWSWSNAGLQQQAFRDLIRSSDDAYRNAQGQLGLLLANHIVSALDALISARLTAAAGRTTSLRTLIEPGAAHVALRVAF